METYQDTNRLSGLSISAEPVRPVSAIRKPRYYRARSLVIGVDVGGTHMRAAVLDAHNILSRTSNPTPATAGAAVIIARIIAAIQTVMAMAEVNLDNISAICVGVPGLVNSRTGVVFYAPNLCGWNNIPLRDELSQSLHVPIVVTNDASLAALAEHHYGAGIGINDIIYLTVSTGIGSGIIINGDIFEGVSGTAGQIGHMYINRCPDAPRDGAGHVGCLEALASGTAIARDANMLVASGRGQCIVRTQRTLDAQNPLYAEQASISAYKQRNKQLTHVTARAVIESARLGDSEAMAIIGAAAQALGIACTNLVHCFNPAMIVIGGGVSKAGPLLFDPIRETLKARAFERPAQDVQVVPALLGDDAGLIGAAAWVKYKLSA